jgi:hypothetical protein
MFFLAALAAIGTTVAQTVEADKQTKEAIKNTTEAAFMGAGAKQINAYSSFASSVPTGH